jgi:hypothetical protein
MAYPLFILVNAACFLWLVGSEAEEFFLHELAVFGGVLAAVLVAQLLLTGLVVRLARAQAVPRLADQLGLGLLAAATVANAYHFCFGEYHIQAVYQWLLAALAGGLFLAAATRPAATRAGALFAGLSIAMSLLSYAAERIGMAHADLPQSEGAARFAATPNVYAISFESLVSPRALALLYSAGEAPHFDLLRSHGFRVLERAYSADWATLPSLARILDFDVELATAAQMRAVFGSANTTYRHFKANGYQISFIYSSNYMGVNRGGADYFYPAVSFSTCHFLSERYGYFACAPGFVRLVNRELFQAQGHLPADQHVQLINDRVDAIMAAGRPGLVVSHIDSPAHTDLDHDYRDQAAHDRFIGAARARLPEVARHLERLLGHIRQRDPEAVILIYSDHGAWMTRGMTAEQASAGTPQFPRAAVVEDRHGVVALAVYPADFCADRLGDGASTLFLMKDLIACLSGQAAVSDAERAGSRSIYWLGQRTLLSHLLE